MDTPILTVNEDSAPVAIKKNAALISPPLIAATPAAVPPETSSPIIAEEISPTISKITS